MPCSCLTPLCLVTRAATVAEQIYGDQSYHDVIRSSVFDYMEKNADYYSQYVTEDIHAYIARKRQDRVFGNQVEIQAITELYGRPVEVYAPEHSSNGTYTHNTCE